MNLNPVLRDKEHITSLLEEGTREIEERRSERGLSAEEIASSDIDKNDSDIVAALKGSRALAIERLYSKMSDISPDKLSGVIEQITKTINTIQGKNDSSINVIIIDDDKRKRIAERIMARTIGE